MVIHPYFTKSGKDNISSRGCAPGVSKVVDKSGNIVSVGAKPMYHSP